MSDASSACGVGSQARDRRIGSGSRPPVTGHRSHGTKKFRSGLRFAPEEPMIQTKDRVPWLLPTTEIERLTQDRGIRGRADDCLLKGSGRDWTTLSERAAALGLKQSFKKHRVKRVYPNKRSA